MPNDNTTWPSAVPIRNGIIMLGGYGIRVSIDRRHLLLADAAWPAAARGTVRQGA